MNKEILEHRGKQFKKYITKEEIAQKTQEIAQQITAEYAGKNPLIIGVLNGAFVWTADLVRSLDFTDLQVEFSKISSYNQDQSGEVKSLIGLKQSIKGRHVILVEDIVDTGKSMSTIIPTLQKDEPASLCLASLFFKKECCKHDVDIKYIGFTIPNKFIIGYGLDFDEFGRALPDVWACQN